MSAAICCTRVAIASAVMSVSMIEGEASQG
jgi:hypothetical protein